MSTETDPNSRSTRIEQQCADLGIEYDEVSPIGSDMPNWDDSFTMIENVLNCMIDGQTEAGDIADILTDVYSSSCWAWLARNYTTIGDLIDEYGPDYITGENVNELPQMVQYHAYYNLASLLLELIGEDDQ